MSPIFIYTLLTKKCLNRFKEFCLFGANDILNTSVVLHILGQNYLATKVLAYSLGLKCIRNSQKTTSL